MRAERRVQPVRARRLALAALALAAAAGLAPAARADTLRIDDTGVVVTARSVWPARLTRGWFPLQVRVENEGEEAATLLLTAEGGFRTERRVRKRVRAEPGATLDLELLLPVVTYESTAYHLEVELDGRRDTERLSETFGGGSSSFSEARAVLVLVSAKPEEGSAQRWVELLSADLPKLGDAGSRSQFSWWHQGQRGDPAVSLAVATFADLSPRHEAYSSLDLVVLDANADLPAERELGALFSWVRLGGTLLVHGAGARARLEAIEAVRPYLDERFEEEPESASARVFGVGLGRLVVDASGDVPYLGSAAHDAIVQDLVSDPGPAFVPGPNHSWVDGSEQPPPIPGVGDLPYRGFALLLILFAVVIGPVNFILVKRRGRPGMLLVTIPGIALVASLGFLGYGVFHQGLDVKLLSRSLTFLDQRTHRAATVEDRAMFAGMSPGEGLRPSAGTACFALRLSTGSFNDEIRFDVDATNGEVLAGEFLPVRRTAHMVQLSERASRLRLGLAREGGTVRAENALDAEVTQLVVRDRDGSWYASDEPLAAGGTVALRPIDDLAGRSRAERLLRERRSLPDRLASGALPPGTYAARLATSPFVDASGIETTRYEDGHLLVGILGEEAGR